MRAKKERVARLFTWITVILSLVILVGTTGSGIYIWMQGDNGEASELLALSGKFFVLSGILCFVGTWTIYASVRWIQIPIWRWIIGGFKGAPDTPFARFVITREQIAEAKKKMSRLQRICVWVGNVCMALGVLFMLIGVLWLSLIHI